MALSVQKLPTPFALHPDLRIPLARMQTNKRRPVVPICPTLRAELETWERDSTAVVSLRGKPLATSEFFDNLAEAAGVTGGAHVIRHTVRTWLAEQGVPDSDAA